MLKTENLELRTPSEDLYEALHRVTPCDEYYQMVGSDAVDSLFSNDEKFKKSFEESLKRENYWHVFSKGKIIGITFLHSLDQNDRRARFAVGIYNLENWNKGYGQEITTAVLQHAFSTLLLHKVELRVLAFNKRAINSYKKVGFIYEGTLRDNAYINNEWHDDIIMSILHSEYKAK